MRKSDLPDWFEVKEWAEAETAEQLHLLEETEFTDLGQVKDAQGYLRCLRGLLSLENKQGPLAVLTD